MNNSIGGVTYRLRNVLSRLNEQLKTGLKSLKLTKAANMTSDELQSVVDITGYPHIPLKKGDISRIKREISAVERRLK